MRARGAEGEGRMVRGEGRAGRNKRRRERRMNNDGGEKELKTRGRTKR